MESVSATASGEMVVPSRAASDRPTLQAKKPSPDSELIRNKHRYSLALGEGCCDDDAGAAAAGDDDGGEKGEGAV